ncbi:MAG: GNAT family N-acetyltransferase, partial [Anaerolineae bacterium]
QFRHHIGVTCVAADGDDILGFLTVSPASLDVEEMPGGRGMPPYPVPVLRIARLAVDEHHAGRGLGKALLRFSIELAERMRYVLGCVGLVVDAKAEMVAYYERLGFEPIDALEGATLQRPAPKPVFLALGAVPPRRDN